MNKLVIGVAGGTGSGKTTVVRKIAEQLPRDKFVILQQDSYYKDGSHMSLEDRKKINYDHPLAFDNDLLIEHIKSLLEGKAIEVPIYSFITYTRKPDAINVKPTNIMIVEGILILEDARIRDLLDIMVFVDTDADERFIRRLKRDLVERGRNVEEVINQYTTVVRPMHNQFVEPTKRYADIIVPEGGSNAVAIDILTSKIKSILAGI
ncbi:MAG: uridine kinase [Firmicutes bacterium]|nr:uridine kinase [Bacillota bacterium]